MKSSNVSSDIASIPAMKALLRARAENRMPHAVLFTGLNTETLIQAVECLASIHLASDDPLSHPDCRLLRPGRKSRRINQESTLEVVSDLQLSSLSGRRVVIVHEPDRFEASAANAFLKTLEEPPSGTLVILQTTHYYRVLPTVLSRCLRFHIGGEPATIQYPEWLEWLRQFDRFLAGLSGSLVSSAKSTETIIPLYALCASFEDLLEKFLVEELKLNPAPPPSEDDGDDVKEAHKESMRRDLWSRMLLAMEERLRVYGRQSPNHRLATARAIRSLEAAKVRFELNFSVVAAIEGFFIQTLKAFAAQPK